MPGYLVGKDIVPTHDTLLLYDGVLEAYLNSGLASIGFGDDSDEAREAMLDALYFSDGANIGIEKHTWGKVKNRKNIYALYLCSHSTAPRIYGDIHTVWVDGEPKHYFFALECTDWHKYKQSGGKNEENALKERVYKTFNNGMTVAEKDAIVSNCRRLSQATKALRDAEDKFWKSEREYNRSVKVGENPTNATEYSENRDNLNKARIEVENAKKVAGTWRPLRVKLRDRYEEMVENKENNRRTIIANEKRYKGLLQSYEEVLQTTGIATQEDLDNMMGMIKNECDERVKKLGNEYGDKAGDEVVADLEKRPIYRGIAKICGSLALLFVTMLFPTIKKDGTIFTRLQINQSKIKQEKNVDSSKQSKKGIKTILKELAEHLGIKRKEKAQLPLKDDRFCLKKQEGKDK